MNAGIFKMATLDAVSLEDLDQMIAINVRGVCPSTICTSWP